MFTLDEKEYDETKLEGKAKIAFANSQLLLVEKSKLMHQLEKNQILTRHYSEMLKKNLPNGKDKKQISNGNKG